jgi:hypothetical protein
MRMRRQQGRRHTLGEQFAGGSRVIDPSNRARGVAIGALAYGKVMPYIGDGARGQAVSQKNEQFGDVMDGGYIAHVWLRDGALILKSNWLGCHQLHRRRPRQNLTCSTLWTIGKSNQGYELTLNISVTIDVGLGGLDRPVTSKQLHVPQ